LIVDDEPQNRKLLEALLRPEGYVTRTANNGDEALAAVRLHFPDLILLDVMMPGMDGYEVAKILKTDPTTLHIPIIMVTAGTDPGALLDGLNAGAEEFLTKPVNRAELWLRVRNLLRLKELRDLVEHQNKFLEEESWLARPSYSDSGLPWTPRATASSWSTGWPIASSK
jgi:CheY-like chemotaxis protein